MPRFELFFLSFLSASLLFCVIHIIFYDKDLYRVNTFPLINEHNIILQEIRTKYLPILSYMVYYILI